MEGEVTRTSIISLSIAALAAGGMVFAFLQNASPYVSAAEAKTMKGDNLHVVGDIDKATVDLNIRQGQTRFAITDEKGDRLSILYTGAPISNMGSATRIVVVGGMDGSVFHAHKVLVKCPSKYEGEAAHPAAEPKAGA
jgi:cytochrome c-type biogenesis protein CcmE